MRILNKLNQFQRLWQPSAGEPQQVTVTELAAHCFCSERHIRTLLGQLTRLGWLQWQAQSGRGKRGLLTFLRTPERVRAELMEQVLNKGLHQNALDLAKIAPDQLRHLLQPFLGGQWQNNVPTLRIPYYRPLEPIESGFLAGRAEQHLSRQIFSGLTRFTREHALPQPDLAHHWQVSDDGLCWDFFIHPTLYWHNGEPLDTAQLQQQLQRLLQLPDLKPLFASVKSIERPHTGCLRFVLFHPDYWLAHRLASYCSRIAHPQHRDVGCGPFRIVSFKDNLVRLESFEYYHLRHPLLQAVELWITPQLFNDSARTGCLHPVQIAIGQQEQLTDLRPITTKISLGFCFLSIKQHGKLTQRQARALMQMVREPEMVATLPLDSTLITPNTGMLPGWQTPEWEQQEATELPKTLTLIYHLPVELHAMAQQLKDHLAARNCELKIIFHNAKNWSDCQRLEEADLIMGDRLIGEEPEYTLEQWLRVDKLWPALFNPSQYASLQTHLDKIQCSVSELQRIDGLKTLFYTLMEDAVITPLFNYRYQISAPPGVRGVKLNTWGWFDFADVWLPPPDNA